MLINFPITSLWCGNCLLFSKMCVGAIYAFSVGVVLETVGELMDTTLRDRIRHYMNPLHVFCGIKLIFSKENALKVAKLYEKLVFRPMVTLFF